jgi:hypothetical protein
MDGAGEFDWRQHHKSLGEQLWYMYQFEIETDLEIDLYEDQIKKVLYPNKTMRPTHIITAFFIVSNVCTFFYRILWPIKTFILFQQYRCHKLIFLRLSSNFQILIEDYDKVEGEVYCISVSSVSSSAFEIILRYVLK